MSTNSMIDKPLISVVIPVYEKPNFLAAAIASVLNQTFSDFELLLVDDGFGPSVSELADEFADSRIKVMKHYSNRGTSAARNTGIREARGEYCALLDADDTWYPNKLRSQLDWMRSEAGTERASCTAYRLVTPYHPDGQVRPSHSPFTFNDMLWGCPLSPGSTLMFHKSVFAEIGPFNESLRRLEDWEWLLRYTHKRPLPILQEVLAVIEVGRPVSYQLEHLLSSESAFERSYLNSHHEITGRQKRIMKSTLYLELAAGAYRTGAYFPAANYLARSVYYQPVKRLEFYLRLARAAKSDMLHAGRRRYHSFRYGSATIENEKQTDD